MRAETKGARYELKYVLPSERRAEVIGLVAKHARPDPRTQPLGGGRLGYEVHSLYLDTPGLRDYFARLERRSMRVRFRVRTYGDKSHLQGVFLEIKRKCGARVVKQRSLVCTTDEWSACTSSNPWHEVLAGRPSVEWAASRFCSFVDGGRRRPVCIVHYQREVLVPIGDDRRHVRLTLDSDVGATVHPDPAQLFAAPSLVLLPSGWMIMELKFDRLPPSWMRRLPQALGVSAVPVSKFALAVASGLRAHRPRELATLAPAPLRARKEAA